MRRALLPLLLLSSLSVAGFQAQTADTYTLVHKHTLGELQAITMKIEGKFGEVNFVSTVDLSQKVTEVAEDGGYTVEITSGDTKTTVNGEEVPADDSDEPKTKTQKYDAKGKRILAEGEEETDEGPIGSAFDYEPKAPVKIGDTWKPEKTKADGPEPLDWTLTGKEELGGKEVLVIEGKGTGENGEMIVSKVWLDPITFIARKASATVRGIKQEGSDEGEMTISIEEKA